MWQGLGISCINILNMKDDTIEAELTADLRDFLERRGYSHINSLGIEPKEMNDANEPETERENYWLEPVKPGDERMKAGNLDNTIMEIAGSDVVEMVNGADDIQYMIRVPLIDYNDYLAKR
jgi:hypothetical protein